ncbi:cyclic nucleotide-binding domain-containing protein [Leptospira sp. 96542]|nr:cyclic nucleotide-binding domain-containing protein [Leptospira sp. 96542]
MNLDHLRKHLTTVQVDHFPKGKVVFSEGEESNGKMYFVFSGKLDVFKKKASGEDSFLRIISPGEFFGEMALVFPYPRAATIIASAEDTKVGIITKEIFIGMGKESPEFLSVILQSIIRRLTSVEDTISEKQKELHILINGMPTKPIDSIVPMVHNNPPEKPEADKLPDESKDETETGFIPPTT